MRQAKNYICAIVLTLTCASWGFFAHRTINRMAIFTLPRGMARFYKANIDFLTEHAVDADKRRYTDTSEGPRHFLDADHYGKSPFDSIPQKWTDAEKMYSRRFLTAYGTLPWQIQRTYYALVKAFSAHDSLRILRLSADLGHYLGDAHVPLHTTENYNGQMSGQTGIHAFWESRLPELFSGRYDFLCGPAKYVENPLREAWRIVRQSYELKDSVLQTERQLSSSFPASQKYSYEFKGGKPVRTYSDRYSEAWHRLLNGMVEARMKSAIKQVGNFWYSAWIDAGQPDLNGRWLIKPDSSLAEKPSTEPGVPIGREL